VNQRASISQWLSQMGLVIRLEMRKTFFSRRGLWVYLLALAPVLIFLGHSLSEINNRKERQALNAAHPVSTAALRSIQRGSTIEEVVEKVGEPFAKNGFHRPNITVDIYQYTDGENIFVFGFRNNRVENINERDRDTIPKDSLVFASVFQFFYLRLAIFFGCVGVFTNLFRGEMLDKSLHFYLLTPIRREILAIGKYLAGLIATVVIFCTSTFLQLAALSLHFTGSEISEYLAGPGWGHVASYLGVTAAACVGYGSIFLAAGLLFKNPILPAATVLVWEGANMFLPATLKKVSVIFYLQSLSPVVAPPDANMPALQKLLVTAAEPVPAVWALLGLLTLTIVVLALAARKARKLEINYSTD
jgi:ABC-type transport system involved in multi-copper enzyme maturation permease subunit